MNRKDILSVYEQGTKAVISLIQQMSQHIKKLEAHIEKQDEKQVDSRDMSVILFTKSKSQISSFIIVKLDYI